LVSRAVSRANLVLARTGATRCLFAPPAVPRTVLPFAEPPDTASDVERLLRLPEDDDDLDERVEEEDVEDESTNVDDSDVVDAEATAALMLRRS